MPKLSFDEKSTFGIGRRLGKRGRCHVSCKLKFNIGLWVIIAIVIAIYPSQVCSATQHLEARLPDGVMLKVHFDSALGEQGAGYAWQILQMACLAYQEIVYRQGFSRPDYTFVHPRKDFAYDRDKTIDIYITDVEAPSVLLQTENGFEYEAKVFLPADFQGYRQKYHIKHPLRELKASITHELFHIITYSYNRNMQANCQGRIALTSRRWDWYNEGLARYFETLVGYREEFLSYGFRKSDDEKIMVYKGGVNYFLQYPDKPLNERKYDFALFWQYLDQNYGMDKIEEISYKFRQIDPELCSNQEAMEIIAQTLGVPLKNLLRNFSLYVYKSSTLETKSENGLRPVEVFKLSERGSEVFSISSFGFDFYEVDLMYGPQTIELKTLEGQRDLNCLVAIRSPFNFSSLPFEPDTSGKVNIDTTGFSPHSKMIIMLSNPTGETIFYRIISN